ncbi:hypothetical protein FN846DRAFT_959898 [Sphaerosporella brunnea]|uniref:Uncharacterized protein n=1 Tax=Sphaerosporella brunnea TaxID=1250544 RepID=A0A5J5EQ34_9PEZI|nr:hypothetical protein FN846DRAFT_959898 [Sphaerosporella brunnea]
MAAIITPHSSTGQYAPQYQVQASQYSQQTRQGPPQQQVVIQQAHPPYQQQQVVQQQPVMQTRIVHTSPRQIVQEDTTVPIRQFVNFKNLRHLNQPGQQWEHCEHITIALSPDELERKIRCHDVPGNDLIRCLTSMGVYRQRHVRKYEEKLNNRESDPGNWSWTLEALGEVRDKPKATPHTFWAIFQRTSRKDNGQQSRQSRLQPVTVHHEPVQIMEAPQMQQLQAPPVVPALPPPQPMLALPASQQQQPQYGQATIQPASSIGTVSAANYQYTPQQHQTTYRAQQRQQQAALPPVLHQQQQQQPQAQTQRQQPQIHQKPQPRQIAAAPTAAPQAPALRQITQAPAQTATAGTTTPAAAKAYTRPIPGPISLSRPVRRAPSPLRNYTRTSDIELRQFLHQQANNSPTTTPRHERPNWYDDDDNHSLSDDSASSYDSSASTDMTEFSIPRRRLAPLGGDRVKTNSAGHRRRSGELDTRCLSGSPRHPQHPGARLHEDRSGERRNYVPAPARPQITRQNTYDIEVKIGPTQRPGPPTRAHSYGTDTTTPRSYRHHPEQLSYDYESSDGTEAGAARGGFPRVRRTDSSARRNGYEAAGLVSYGSDRDGHVHRGRRI